MQNVQIISHPLVLDKLTIMRSKHTDSSNFRMLMAELAQLLCYEATRDLSVFLETLETPMGITAEFPMVQSKQMAFVAVLRAGMGMLDGALRLVPSAHVGHIGLYRDPKIFSVIEYYFKLPADIEDKHVFVLDPIIATGHSAAAAVTRIKELNPHKISFITLVAAPEGLEYFASLHPEVTIYTAAVDQKLNARNYIVPGLGDAGDRLFGTA